jgi:hypothetical protein
MAFGAPSELYGKRNVDEMMIVDVRKCGDVLTFHLPLSRCQSTFHYAHFLHTSLLWQLSAG